MAATASSLDPISTKCCGARDAPGDGRRKLMKRFRLGLIAAAVSAATLLPTGSALAEHPSPVSRATASWWWDDSSVVGLTTLVRTPGALDSTYRARDLTPGDAVTLWFIVFNHPENCSTTPCSIAGDVFNPAAGADFYWGDGRVVGDSGRVTFVGRLRIDDTTHSGKAETGLAEPVPLSNPLGAEVVLALHSHGPAATGDALAAQLNSFTGGCEVFNGVDGFATGFGDLPDAPGECATLTRALHD
jgi:hypothetical protein